MCVRVVASQVAELGPWGSQYVWSKCLLKISVQALG